MRMVRGALPVHGRASRARPRSHAPDGDDPRGGDARRRVSWLRSFFVYLPVAILGTFVAVHLTQALLGATDALSAAVADGIAGDVSEIFDSVGGTLSRSVGVTGSTSSFVRVFFGALLLIVGSFFVWLELLVRSAAVTAASSSCR